MGTVSLSTVEYNALLRKADLVDRLVSVDPGWRNEEPMVCVNLEELRPQIEDALANSKFKATHRVTEGKLPNMSTYMYEAIPVPAEEDKDNV
jgi:hypothetical protein